MSRLTIRHSFATYSWALATDCRHSTVTLFLRYMNLVNPRTVLRNLIATARILRIACLFAESETFWTGIDLRNQPAVATRPRLVSVVTVLSDTCVHKEQLGHDGVMGVDGFEVVTAKSAVLPTRRLWLCSGFPLYGSFTTQAQALQAAAIDST